VFWDSALAGLKVLTYWETYVAGLEYLAIFFIPVAIVGMIMEKSEGGGAAVGCLSMLLLPVIQVAAMAVFVMTLAPIIFGFTEDAAWSFPWKILAIAPGAFFKLVGVLTVVAIVLAFIPILGQLNSLQTLVLGGIALIFVLGILDSVNPGIVKGRVDFVPGFWFSVGLLVIGGVMARVGMLVAALIATGFEISGEGIGQLLMFPIGAIFGFIPLFMYGAWLGAQVRGGF
jgi:hypothetical protein